MENQRLKWVYLILLSLIWGSSFILIKKALVGLSVLQVGALRIFLTALFLFPVGVGRLKHIAKKDVKWIFYSGLLGSFFPPFLFALAQSKIDSGLASILNSLTPLHTLLLGVFAFGVMISKKQIIGVFVGLLGTVVLLAAGADFNTSQNYIYTIFILLSSWSYAANINIVKRYLSHTNALAMTTASFLMLLLPAFLLVWYSGFFSTILEDKNMQRATLYIVFLAAFGTAIAKVLFNRLVQIASPVFAASVTYVIPMIAVFWGVLDAERLSPWQVLGALIILFGVYLSNKKKKSVV